MSSTTPDSGGTATSFSNTPQAQDDYYAYLEDLLRSNSTLYNSLTNTIYLDVMSNDLGGKAKTLFSIEDGDGNPITADYELLAKDVNAAGCSPWEATLNGNWVRINNGKIEYRISDGSSTPGAGRSVDTLTAGEVFCDEFVYAIRLGNGTLSEATVKINITGANDAASISVVGTPDTSATEAGGVANGTPGDPIASGQLQVNDIDSGENKFQAPPASSLNGTYGNFTFNNITGQWTYTLDNGRPATEGLDTGDLVTETLTVTSWDGTASYTITINIAGTDDQPTLAAVASGSIAEVDQSSATTSSGLSGTLVGNDVDGDSLTY
ncbi:MAG TPA: VCBS domain-containing protein, partial [Sphingomicrobium sp.]|nr:VCBS domain-containing protein [Sphingomicrobium sp.]